MNLDCLVNRWINSEKGQKKSVDLNKQKRKISQKKNNNIIKSRKI
jgi:hypothetical protein